MQGGAFINISDVVVSSDTSNQRAIGKFFAKKKRSLGDRSKEGVIFSKLQEIRAILILVLNFCCDMQNFQN